METTLHAPTDTAVHAQDDAARLWNPTAAVLWSLLFSPALGAWLLMRNWERLGERVKARQARFWFVGLLAIYLTNAVVVTVGVLLEREIGMPWWTGLMLWGAWGVQSAYPQISHVEDAHGEDYARQSWSAPLLAAIAAHLALPVLAGIAIGIQAAVGA